MGQVFVSRLSLGQAHGVTTSSPEPSTSGHAGPAKMRQMLRDYIVALHGTYLGHTRHQPPGERAALPLRPGMDLTVAVAAAHGLHLVAVVGALPRVTDEADTLDAVDGLQWTVRFYDPSVIPELGLLPEDAPWEVRRVLGIAAPLYHLRVSPGAGLSDHHAQHSGVALSNDHTRRARDLAMLRAALPGREATVQEFSTCVRLGLDRAAELLASELTAGSQPPRPGVDADRTLKALVHAVGSS